jgi:hypothetical protein
LAIAAMDMGRIKLADVSVSYRIPQGTAADTTQEQLSVLEKQFSGSPRVALLLGLRAEAKGETDKAKKMYEDLLAKDETNVVSRCLHSALRPTGVMIPPRGESSALGFETG